MGDEGIGVRWRFVELARGYTDIPTPFHSMQAWEDGGMLVSIMLESTGGEVGCASRKQASKHSRREGKSRLG